MILPAIALAREVHRQNRRGDLVAQFNGFIKWFKEQEAEEKKNEHTGAGGGRDSDGK